MAAVETLYSPEVLALATSLAQWPWDEALPLQGSARSKSCGSIVHLALSADSQGRADRIGIRAQACAVGQAAAAIFAGGAAGRTGAEIAAARREIGEWLQGERELPDWPGLGAIAAAQAFPGRHGAIVLAWQAATELLSTAANPR